MNDRLEVSLRPFQPGDAPAVHRWFNNPAATASLMEQRDSFSPAEAEAWVARAMDDSGEDRKYAIVVEGYAARSGEPKANGRAITLADGTRRLLDSDISGTNTSPNQ